MIFTGGFERNDGVFFLEFQEKFKESAQVTSWPGALVSSLRLFLGNFCVLFLPRSSHFLFVCLFFYASKVYLHSSVISIR